MTPAPRSRISPSTPGGAFPSASSRMRSSALIGTPTEPSLRCPGGSKLEQIVDAVSVRRTARRREGDAGMRGFDLRSQRLRNLSDDLERFAEGSVFLRR